VASSVSTDTQFQTRHSAFMRTTPRS
jgi:hypothetical protein